MVDLNPVFKWGPANQTEKAFLWSKMSGIWMVRQVTWLHHLNTKHPHTIQYSDGVRYSDVWYSDGYCTYLILPIFFWCFVVVQLPIRAANLLSTRFQRLYYSDDLKLLKKMRQGLDLSSGLDWPSLGLVEARLGLDSCPRSSNSRGNNWICFCSF